MTASTDTITVLKKIKASTETFTVLKMREANEPLHSHPKTKPDKVTATSNKSQ